MSDMKWSEKQPEDWQGAPFGSEPPTPEATSVPAPPAGWQSTTDVTPAPARFEFGTVLTLTWRGLIHRWPLMLMVSAVSIAVSIIMSIGALQALEPAEGWSPTALALLSNQEFPVPTTGEEIEAFLPELAQALMLLLTFVAISTSVQFFVSIALTALAMASLKGERPTFGHVVSRVPWGSAVGATLLLYAMFIALLLANALIWTAGSAAIIGVIGLFVAIASIVFAIWLGLGTTMLYAVINGEKLSARKAIVKSLELSRRRRWWILLLLLIVGLMSSTTVSVAVTLGSLTLALPSSVPVIVATNLLPTLLSIPATAALAAALYSHVGKR